MVQRRNIQVLNDLWVIWPIVASLLLHIICPLLIAMPHAPNVPELFTLELALIPQFQALVPLSKTAVVQNVAAAAAKMMQSQPIAKNVEIHEPVIPVNTIVPETRITMPPHASVAVQAAATVQPGSAVAVKGAFNSVNTESVAPIGSVEGTFGALDGPSFLTVFRPVYPRMARKLGKQGTVLLRIGLDERGALRSMEVVEKVGYGLDEAALKAVKASRFRPAKQRGIPVGCTALLPITFKLED